MGPGARYLALTAVLALAVPAAASAQQFQVAELPMPVPGQPSASQKAGILKKVGIDQRIGQQLPLNAAFVDDNGRSVRLGDYFGKRPVVMALVYYDCPMLCTYVLNGLTATLKALSFTPGQDFDIVAISIDPNETYRVAQAKKAVYVRNYGRPETASGWHFLTGSDPSIHAVADAIGFHYAYDPNLKQYAHGAAIYVATPSGEVARYFLGLDYASRDLRLALVEASHNRLGTVVDQALLLCYHYDPTIGKYGAATLLAVRIGFIATVLGLLSFIFVSLRRERRSAEMAHRT
jgi:protein SCO1/2